MTISAHEERERQQAELAEFEARFQKFLDARIEQDQQRAQQDQQPVTERVQFGADKDLKQQYTEQQEALDQEFRTETRALEEDNHTDHEKFASWLKGQREGMRARSLPQQPKKLAPQLVPSFVLGPSSAQSSTAPKAPREYTQQDKLRDEAAQGMQQRFDAYQSQEHEKRLAALHERHDQKRDLLDNAFKKEISRQRPVNTNQEGQPAPKYKRLPDETATEFAARVERAEIRAAKLNKDAFQQALDDKGPERKF